MMEERILRKKVQRMGVHKIVAKHIMYKEDDAFTSYLLRFIFFIKRDVNRIERPALLFG
jgi:hypothetical protein